MKAPAIADAGEADAIDGAPLPRQQQALFGHGEAARALHEGYRAGRLHHALMLAGPRGIGKATLAFRFARFVLSHPQPEAAPPAGEVPLLPADPAVAGKIAAGSHPNVFHLRRPWDDRTDKWRTSIPVDSIRRAGQFFAHSAAGAGWRVAIVDVADDMLEPAANALLKMLEEPPARALFLLVTHAPGRLLPTIRSRCRRIALRPLGEADLLAALETLGAALSPEERAGLPALAEGSVRAALELTAGKGLALHRAFHALVAGLPRIDRAALHALADQVAPMSATADHALVISYARRWLADRLRDPAIAGNAAALGRVAAAWETITRASAEAAEYNLDRRQTILDTVARLAEAAAGD